MKTTQTVSQLISKLPGKSNCILISGTNFSGRSEILKNIVQMNSSLNYPRGPYIGPDAHVSITSLMPTVYEELNFHCANSPIREIIYEIAEQVGLSDCFKNNPFARHLSGGQEVMLVLLSKLALCYKFLASDTSVEQLSYQNKRIFYELIKSNKIGLVNLFIADNRGEKEFDEKDKVLSKNICNCEKNNGWLKINSICSNKFSVTQCHPLDIVLKNVSFSYSTHSKNIFTNISAHLQGGQIYTLQGNNGCGKSTLAKLLSGIASPTTGEIFLKAHHSYKIKTSPLSVAYHFQDPNLQLFAVDIKSEILSSLHEFHGKSNLEEWYNIIMNSFGLELISNVNPFDLPFALRKRLALAATIAQHTPWLILDEPTIGQDEETCEQIIKIIHTLAVSGRGVIVISHADEFLSALHGRKINISNGLLEIS